MTMGMTLRQTNQMNFFMTTPLMVEWTPTPVGIPAPYGYVHQEGTHQQRKYPLTFTHQINSITYIIFNNSKKIIKILD